MDIKRLLMVAALGVVTTGAAVKFNRNGCGDGSYTRYHNGCEVKVYPAFVEGNRCEANMYQECTADQTSVGNSIQLYDGYSDQELGLRVFAYPSVLDHNYPIYWTRQRENSDYYWRISKTGMVLGAGSSGQSKGENIIGLETEADRAERTRIYGLLKKCEGMLEMKLKDSF